MAFHKSISIPMYLKYLTNPVIGISYHNLLESIHRYIAGDVKACNDAYISAATKQVDFSHLKTLRLCI